MINRTILSIIVLLFISCSKEKIDEYATGTSQDGIVGRWKLVESRVSDGANTHTTDLSSKNYIVIFESNGTVSIPEFPCTGKYTFDKRMPEKFGESNLQLTFDNCKATEIQSHSMGGDLAAHINDSNTLSVNSPNCIEGCAKIYRRLK